MGVVSERQFATGAPSPRLMSRLDRALAHAGRTHDLSDVIERLKAGDAQVWGTSSSAVVTELVAYPRFTALRYWLGAGDLDELLAMQPVIDAWARERGAQRAEATGRVGWLRRSPGWLQGGVFMTKDLAA